MSWHFSQALEVEYLGGNCLDGIQCAQWKSMPIVHDDSCSDKMKDSFHRSPFGMMYVLSTDAHGTELLTLFLEDSRARTSVRQAKEPELTETEADYGRKWQGSFAKLDLGMFSWKTAQFSLLEDLEPSLEIWPKWGLMLDGECWELLMPDMITKETASGLLPTPLKSDGKGGSKAPFRMSDGRLRNEWKHYVNQQFGLTYPHPIHSEIRLGWPIGWTDCKPLEMDRFQQWLQWHGKY